MVSTHVITTGAPPQAPPVVRQLEAIFAKLDDEALLETLIGPIRRGPKGHPAKVLWHCVLAKYVMGLSCTDALIRELNNNPLVAKACGIDSPEAIPHKSTFSRFFTKLSKYGTAARVKDVSRSLVRRCYSELPGFGERVAMDSTVIKAWSNGGKSKKSDPDAGWAVKKSTNGHTEYTYGYKTHLLVDCEYELPIAANISAGNVNDAARASHLLRDARRTHSHFRPRFVIADTGYSGQPLFHLIQRQYQGHPIIGVNRSHKRLRAELSTEMNTPEWKALYGQRQAVEHVNSRLKGQRSLNHVTVRGLRKVTVHCYLALIAMQGKATISIISGQMLEQPTLTSQARDSNQLTWVYSQQPFGV